MGVGVVEQRVQTLQLCDVSAAACEGYRLTREGHVAPLRLRRLVLSTSSRPRSAAGVRKQRPSRTARRLTHSVGAIFGATLRSVLDFSGTSMRKRDVVNALQHAARFLAPTKDAVYSETGTDRVHLSNGLMSQFVATAQRRKLDECHESQSARTYLGRSGLNGISVGATASVLVAHYVMSARGDPDPAGVLVSLTDSLARVDAILSNWVVTTNRDDEWHMEALRAETRAVGRARAVAVAVAEEARAQRLSASSTLLLQFEWMRNAVWPRDAHVDASTHVLACQALGRGEALGRGGALPSIVPPPPAPPLLTLPLAALPPSVWICSAASSASSSSGDSRSESGSIASSVSLSSMNSDAGEGGGVHGQVSGGEAVELSLAMFGL